VKSPYPSRVVLALVLGAIAFSGCGGTNSETPWPVEPEDVDLGPEGEARGNADLGAPAPAGAKTAPKKPAASGSPAPASPAPAAAPRAPAKDPEPSAPSNPSTQF
jgi:hypothetical protein